MSFTESNTIEAYLYDLLEVTPPADVLALLSAIDVEEQQKHKLRAIILSVRSDGVIRANEEMTAWLRGERSMPFGQNNEHVPVRLIDFDNLEQNQYVVTQQFVYRAGSAERRFECAVGR